MHEDERIMPTVPPPYTSDAPAACSAAARLRAASTCSGDFPGAEPQLFFLSSSVSLKHSGRREKISFEPAERRH